MAAQYRESADAALRDVFTIQGVTAEQKRLPGGGYDWNWRGPRNDPEWAWFFNRLMWLPDLWRSYKETGETRYLSALVSTLEDWMDSNPAPGRFNFTACWRPLEVARRLLYVLLPYWETWLENDEWPPALTERLKLSLEAHGCQLRKHHAFGGNHLITEMRALLALAYACPWLSASEEWTEYSLCRLERSYHQQVYPDGVYKELSTHYHRIVTQNYTAVLDIVKTHTQDSELIEKWSKRVFELWSYMQQVMKPNGKNPLNNDSDVEEFEKIISREAPAGVIEKKQSSRHYRWAGQSVFRGILKKDWAFFDHGPRGTDHDHVDFNNITLSVEKYDFLVDAGRYTYEPGRWREYFSGLSAHNIVSIDGHACEQFGRSAQCVSQMNTFAANEDSVSDSGKSYFYRDGIGRFGDWERRIVYTVDQCWDVADEIVTFGQRKIRTYWHFHPDCRITGDLRSTQGLHVYHEMCGLGVRLICDQDVPLEVSIVSGVEASHLQGWYSPSFNHKVEAPVIVVEQTAKGPFTNQWTFQPLGRSPASS